MERVGRERGKVGDDGKWVREERKRGGRERRGREVGTEGGAILRLFIAKIKTSQTYGLKSQNKPFPPPTHSPTSTQAYWRHFDYNLASRETVTRRCLLYVQQACL